MPDVAVILGSASDVDLVAPCLDTLKSLDISFCAKISSAHRTPERTEKIIKDVLGADVKVFICAAGMAAHLAGAVAARTLRPVIGLPLAGPTLSGLDALFSTVQMPAGYPVATVALNGAKNAAWLAAQILALQDKELEKRIMHAREAMAKGVEEADADLEAELNGESSGTYEFYA